MRIAAFCLCIALLTGCSVLPSEQPPVEDSTLVEVLIEMHLLEARDELGHDVPEHARDSILTRYGLTEPLYEEAIAYYADRPDEYLVLYRQVIETLSEEEVTLHESQ